MNYKKKNLIVIMMTYLLKNNWPVRKSRISRFVICCHCTLYMCTVENWVFNLPIICLFWNYRKYVHCCLLLTWHLIWEYILLWHYFVFQKFIKVTYLKMLWCKPGPSSMSFLLLIQNNPIRHGQRGWRIWYPTGSWAGKTSWRPYCLVWHFYPETVRNAWIVVLCWGASNAHASISAGTVIILSIPTMFSMTERFLWMVSSNKSHQQYPVMEKVWQQLVSMILMD